MNNPMAWLADKIADVVGSEGARVRAELAAGFTQTHNALRINAARYRTAPQASQLVWGGPGRLVGWSLYANGGPYRVILHDGRDASGEVLAVIDLANLEQETTSLASGGVTFTEALYAEVVGAGPVVGSVWLGVVG